MEETLSQKEKKELHIYDKIFKRMITLSAKSVIQFINGLYGTDYPLDSEVDYKWTENQDRDLRRTIADVIITVAGDAYHMEAQMFKDGDILFRMFEYGYSYARKNQTLDSIDQGTLIFPEPRVIILYSKGNTPANYHLNIKFGSQGTFPWLIPTFSMPDTTAEYLNRKGMIILIPFQLLKLRNLLAKDRSNDNIEQLRRLIHDDILSSIEKNYSAGNIGEDDAIQLRDMTLKLYQHLYSRYKEMEETGMNEEVEDDLVLECDKWFQRIREEKAATKKEVTKQNFRLVQCLMKDNRMEELQMCTIDEKLREKLLKEYDVK